MLDHDEVERLYGPWAAHTPRDAAAFLGDYPGRWWIAGGWAIDAYTDTDRVHADLDIGIPRADAAGLHRVRGRHAGRVGGGRKFDTAPP